MIDKILKKLDGHVIEMFVHACDQKKRGLFWAVNLYTKDGTGRILTAQEYKLEDALKEILKKYDIDKINKICSKYKTKNKR